MATAKKKYWSKVRDEWVWGTEDDHDNGGRDGKIEGVGSGGDPNGVDRFDRFQSAFEPILSGEI